MKKGYEIITSDYIDEKTLKNKKFIMNNKEFSVIITYEDKNYGTIVKAVGGTVKNFERIYFMKSGKKYLKITNENILEYLKENYEKMESDVIF